MKNILKIVRNIGKGNYLTILSHDIDKKEEFFVNDGKLFLIDLDSPHIKDEKGNHIYYYDYDSLEVISMKNIPNPNKFYNPEILDLFLFKKVLQQLWSKIREYNNSTGSPLMFILLGVGVGVGVGVVVGWFMFPHQTITQVISGNTTIPQI